MSKIARIIRNLAGLPVFQNNSAKIAGLCTALISTMNFDMKITVFNERFITHDLDMILFSSQVF